MSRTKFWVLIAALAVPTVVAACSSGDAEQSDTPSPTAPVAAVSDNPTPLPPVEGTLVEVQNQDRGGSGEYKFVPSELKFSQGETVTFSLEAETEFHTFTVDELGIDESIDSGETVTVTFTFDKPGTYKLYCIPHESLGMVGEIVVE